MDGTIVIAIHSTFADRYPKQGTNQQPSFVYVKDLYYNAQNTYFTLRLTQQLFCHSNDFLRIYFCSVRLQIFGLLVHFLELSFFPWGSQTVQLFIE